MKNEFKKVAPLVTVTGVSLAIDGKTIIRDIGTGPLPFQVWDIQRPGETQGQVVAVVGASGSGKSTLFKLLSGIIPPTTGTITIPFKSIDKGYKNVEAGDVGFIQQNYPLSRNQTVYQMLKDAARQSILPKSEWSKNIDYYLESWNLKDQRNHSTNQLSGGQRQRVAIIEQLMCSHHYLIADEPFSGLDVRNIDDVINSFKKISTEDEINTIFFSTHDIHLAVELADTIIVMGYERDQNKRLIEGGTIIAEFDLMEMGLAWSEYGPEHRELNAKIKNLIKTSC